MTYIHSIETAFPPFSITNAEAHDQLGPYFVEAGESPEMVRGIFENARVDRRFLVRRPDFYIEHRSLTERQAVYVEEARRLGVAAAKKALDAAGVDPRSIDLVIDTSCTGLMIPALNCHLVNALGMRDDVRRMPLTEVGCAGGAVALSRAFDHIKAYPEARVLITCVELPSLTLQLSDRSRANLVSAAIFGDGAAAAVVSGERPTQGFEVLATRSHLFPRSEEIMGFDLRSEGFKIILSRRIPFLVRDKLRGRVEAFLAERGLSLSDLSFFVLHPGGSKVLDNLRDVLGLTEELVASSRRSLNQFGNLSSASVLLVAADLMRRGAYRDGQYGLLCAMGPGFCLEMALLGGARSPRERRDS